MYKDYRKRSNAGVLRWFIRMGKRVQHSDRKTQKKTRQNETPSVAKETKQENDPGNYDLLKASWRFHRAWEQSTWPLNINGWKDWEKEILPKLIENQGSTWADIKGGNNHNIDLKGLTKAGENELKRLKLDVDRVFSLRLTGKKRIIGILDRGVLEILCYTPNHEFTKTELKHT